MSIRVVRMVVTCPVSSDKLRARDGVWMCRETVVRCGKANGVQVRVWRGLYCGWRVRCSHHGHHMDGGSAFVGTGIVCMCIADHCTDFIHCWDPLR